jgi:polysaccharide biosynthesis transport protein
MELKTYLRIVRRRWWVILVPALVLPLVAYVREASRTDLYQSSAEVLLKPNNQDERLSTAGDAAAADVRDPVRYFAGQITVLESPALSLEVAEGRGRNESWELLNDRISGRQKGTSNVLLVTYVDTDPARAADLANEFARSYIENRRQEQISGLERAEAELEAAVEEIEEQLLDLGRQLNSPATSEAQAALLRVQFEAQNEQFQSSSDRLREVRIDMTLKQGEAELIVQATASPSPFSPQPLRTATLALVLGLLLGAGAALLWEQLDDRLRRRSDVEEATGVKVIGELPQDRASGARPNSVSMLDEPLGQLSESIRQLRTSVRFFGLDRPIERLLVTSADAGEGKSTVSVNLAVALAQGGERTILVSADIRKPRLDAVFGAQGATGLVDVIAEVADFMRRTKSPAEAPDTRTFALEAVRRALSAQLDIPDFTYLPAGSQPPNPAEVLGSPACAAVLDVMSSELADVVVIDSPPVLAVADALVLSRLADSTLIVASAAQTRTAHLTRAIEMFGPSTTRLLGVVLNRVSKTTGGYGYGYGNGYGYGQEKPARTGRRKRTTKRSSSGGPTNAAAAPVPIDA